MMKLSLVLRNKKNALKLSTKSLESFIERIKTDTKDGAVARRRRQLGYGDHIIGYDSQYPSHLIYPSAVFEKDDNDNLRMKTFNGVVALTIEGLENQTDIDAVKRTAQILHYTLAAFVGPSGREVIILVRIAKAEGVSPAITQPYSEITHAYSQISGTYLTEEEADALCQEGHRMAAAIYQAIMPKPILKELVSVRSCFRMPLDPEPYYNPKALALPVRESGGQVHDSLTNQQNFSTSPLDSPSEDSDISQQAQQLIDFLNQRYQFRYNTIMGYTEYKDNDYRYMDWTPVDDRTLKGMTMKVRLGGIDARDNDVRRYVQSNMIRPFNPIGDYLWAQYYKWDGKDHIRKLARTVPNRNPHWEDWFYTWFLGMVRQWQVNNLAKYGNQAVPLLISTQGWNKTTFCEQLLPPELRFGYTGNLQMEDKKQVLQQMAQMLLINLDEFNQISPRTQQGFLKNIITLSSVKIKRPYGRHVEDFPRRASFIATTNQADVLADPSGNRRFLGVELTGPIDVSTPPNYEQLYAQAMRALHQHEPYYFGPAETQEIMEWNRKFSLKTAAEQFFLDYFEPARNEQEGEWMSASAILAYLKNEVGVSLLKSPSVPAFGRKLSAIPGMQKRVTSINTFYLVRKIR
ncbi:MAG: DUF3874 domain-containing protein [Prevotella sp.]|nr:DUF3874 domain-containing protein [Prevotella sp.]